MLTTTFTVDQRWIVSGSKDLSVQFWDPETGIAQLMLQGHKNSGMLSVTLKPSKLFVACWVVYTYSC